MTDRCESIRPRAYSENGCEPTPEDIANKATDDERRRNAEAEARRNANLSSGTDVGGRTSRAASDARAYDPSLKDDPKLKDSRRTSAIDPPLQDDVIGNMLVGAAAGGVGGGVRSLALTSSLRAGTTAAADGAGAALLEDLAKTIACETLKAGDLPAAAAATTADRKSTESASAGMSSQRAASVAAPEPISSEPEPILGPLVFKG